MKKFLSLLITLTMLLGVLASVPSCSSNDSSGDLDGKIFLEGVSDYAIVVGRYASG